MNALAKLKKTKKQRILVLSGGGSQSGIQCIYIGVEGDSWEPLANSVLPYPEPVEALIENLTLNAAATVELDKLAWLDQRLSYLFLECAKNTLAHAHKSTRNPHCIVMNRCTLWKGPVGDTVQVPR
jgi:hypothetical protein